MAGIKIRLLFAGILLMQWQGYLIAQNQRADGYMGLWTRSPQTFNQKSVYAGGLGTFSSQLRPMAIYSPEYRKTFFVYSGTSSPDTSHLQIMISEYDHRSGKVPHPVIVYDKMGVNDPQDNASITIDTGGYIYVFISGRGRTRPGLIFRSIMPGSIQQFEKIFEGEMIFPQPWVLKDSCIFLMYTKVLNGRELYWMSGGNGRNWSPAVKLAGMGGHDQVSGKYGNTVYSVFNYHPGGDRNSRTNLYLIKTDDLGKTWKNIEGKVIDVPLTSPENSALIKDYHAGGKLVYIYDLNFDRLGNPVILALVSNHFLPGPQGAPRELMVIRWNGEEWSFAKVTETDHNYDMGTIFTSDNTWKILMPGGNAPQTNGTGGEIVLWTSNDMGLTWTLSREITSGSRYNHAYPRRVYNPGDKFVSFWADGDAYRISESHLYFTDSRFEKVWRLPYRMVREWEKPLLIK